MSLVSSLKKMDSVINEHQIQSELTSCDVFVFPSLEESFGLSVVEAMSFLKPIVCSDIPALREVAYPYACFVESQYINQWHAAIKGAVSISWKELKRKRDLTEFSEFSNRSDMLKKYLGEIEVCSK